MSAYRNFISFVFLGHDIYKSTAVNTGFGLFQVPPALV